MHACLTYTSWSHSKHFSASLSSINEVSKFLSSDPRSINCVALYYKIFFCRTDEHLIWFNMFLLPQETLLLPLGRTFAVSCFNPVYLVLHLLSDLIQAMELAGLVCNFGDRIPGAGAWRGVGRAQLGGCGSKWGIWGGLGREHVPEVRSCSQLLIAGLSCWLCHCALANFQDGVIWALEGFF